MLEKLARFLGELPPNQHFIEITLPNGLSYEVVSTAHLPGWDDPLVVVSKAWGDRWCQECRSAIAFVPSVVARIERNVLINPAHPEFPQITHSLHQPVWWDTRLF
jgi:RES domain-containing protein